MGKLNPRVPKESRPPSLAAWRHKRPQYTEECPDCGMAVAALLSPDCDPVLDVHNPNAKRIRCNLTAKAVEFGNLGIPFSGGVEGLEQHALKCPGLALRGSATAPAMPVPVHTPQPSPTPDPQPPPAPSATADPEQPAEQPAQPTPSAGGGTGG